MRVRELALSSLLAGVCCTGWAQQALPAATRWYRHYERGVMLVERGQGREARIVLDRALELKADEELRVRTEGRRYVDYLPHLYLAIACHMSGDLPAARLHLAEAERAGVAARSETGRRLLAAFRVLILQRESTPQPETTPPPPLSAQPTSRFMVFDRKPVVLSDSDFTRLQKDVLARCHLSTAGARRKAPWYYHYDLGLELARRGDNQRALDALIEAAQDKPEPQPLARTYGVWFLDYLPYLAIAKAHARLGNLECALDALAVSERLGETSAEASEVKALLAELNGAR